MTNSERFFVVENAIEYLKSRDDLVSRDIATSSEFNFEYLWDVDFGEYFRIDTKKAHLIIKNYPDIDMLLINTYFDILYKKVWEIVIGLLDKMVKDTFNKTINIINISPLEWAILWEVFRELGFKNTIYNFNRTFFINSTSKTLERFLYIYAYSNSKYFKDETKKILDNIRSKNYNLNYDNYYIIIDENNNIEKYDHLEIDNYLKSNIWLKDPKNVYRLDKYPTEDFLHSKDISKINIYDNDLGYGQWYEYYREILDVVPIKKLKYNFIQDRKIWLFEDYLVRQNVLYLNHKKSIENKAYNNYQIYKNSSTGSTNSNLYFKSKPKTKQGESHTVLPYLILFPILFIVFLSSDVGSMSSTTTWTTAPSSSTNMLYYMLGSGNWSLGNSSSSWSSSSSSSSTIKSFWWWGFSKWST